MTGAKRHRISKPPPGDEEATAWEMVWAGEGEAVAEVVAESLRHDGYRAVIRGSNPNRYTQGVFSPQAVWAVLVPIDDAPAARDLLTSRGEPGVTTPPDALAIGLHLHAFKLVSAVGLIALAAYVVTRLLAAT